MGTAAEKISEIATLLDYLNEDERTEVDRILAASLPIWVPQPGPQTDAYYSPADILYYGGAAGGGKSEVLLGLALTSHKRSIIYRREGTQNLALEDRLLNEILKSRNGWNGKDNVWRGDGRQIEFGACKDPGSEMRYQGRPHDLKAFDEITHFLESQFRFLIGWLRSSDPKQRKRIVCTGNPPTNEEGQWVVKFWGPWLDESYQNPAQPGELRWFTTIDGKDVECASGDAFMYNGKRIQPLSRTFIPSKVQDNVFMVESGYEAMLQALPEPLRSQMLLGDFRAGIEDSVWQVIPTAWIDAAMARWTEDGKKGEMDSVGADIARGGRDETVIATRYDNWYGRIQSYPGSQTPDGSTAAGLILSCARDGAPIHVDVIGVGGSVVDHLRSNDVQVIAVNGAEASDIGIRDKATGMLKFRNRRAQIWWQFRESLDPKTGKLIALPPDPQLKSDLCAPHWFLSTQGIQIESKDQIIHGPRLHKTATALGRSPDRADAVVYCSISTPKKLKIDRILLEKDQQDFNPLTFGLDIRQ